MPDLKRFTDAAKKFLGNAKNGRRTHTHTMLAALWLRCLRQTPISTSSSRTGHTLSTRPKNVCTYVCTHEPNMHRDMAFSSSVCVCAVGLCCVLDGCAALPEHEHDKDGTNGPGATTLVAEDADVAEEPDDECIVVHRIVGKRRCTYTAAAIKPSIHPSKICAPAVCVSGKECGDACLPKKLVMLSLGVFHEGEV